MTPAYASAPRRTPREGWLLADLVVGWVLLAVTVVLGALASLVALLSLTMTDACPSVQESAQARAAPCDDGRIATGLAVAGLAHWPILVVGLVLTLALSFTRRPLWWAPLAAGLLGTATFVGGEVWAASGVPH